MLEWRDGRTKEVGVINLHYLLLLFFLLYIMQERHDMTIKDKRLIHVHRHNA